MMTLDKPFLTVQEVAKQLNINARTVSRLIIDGSLPAYKVANMYRINVDDFQAYLEQNRTHPKTEEK